MGVYRHIAVVVVSSVASTGLTVAYGPASSAAVRRDAVVQDQPLVSTQPYHPPADEPSPTDTTDPAWLAPEVALPAPATVAVDVPESGFARAGSLPVSLGRAASGTSPTRVTVRAERAPGYLQSRGRPRTHRRNQGADTGSHHRHE